MAAFAELIWQHIDAQAIVWYRGIATIEEQRHAPCRSWLSRNGYSLDTLDCTLPMDQVVANLHQMLKWEEQFGYTPDPQNRNLMALEDGFWFDIPKDGGHVLELVRVDLAWQHDPEWVRGLLSIVQQYSIRQLALGRRFFALLVVEERSAMIGAQIEPVETQVPQPFWQLNKALHNFER